MPGKYSTLSWEALKEHKCQDPFFGPIFFDMHNHAHGNQQQVYYIPSCLDSSCPQLVECEDPNYRGFYGAKVDFCGNRLLSKINDKLINTSKPQRVLLSV